MFISSETSATDFFPLPDLDLRGHRWLVAQLASFGRLDPGFTGKGLGDFTAHRTPGRREAYSSAAHLINKVADASGVQLITTAYRVERNSHDPLEKLGVEINLQGPYAGLLKFSHALETASDFILIREFTMTPGGQNGALGLRLGAELYLTP